MSWLTWRQHRLAGLTAILLLVAVAMPIVFSGLAMREAYQQLGIGPCAGHTDARCTDLLAQFSDEYRGWGQQLLPWLNFVPALVGALVGGPLLAHELEQRTFLLAWTQGVTRRRWVATKLTVLVVAIVVLGAAFTALISWWRWPLDQLEGHFAPNTFDFEGLAPTATTLFAFAAGSFLGVLLRRTVPAMAATVAAVFAFRYLLIELLLRPRYEAPLQQVVSIADAKNSLLSGAGDWELDSGLQDAAGRHLSVDQIDLLVRRAIDAGITPPMWFQQHGYLRWVVYQPADRFWTFQAIDAAILVAGALALLALTVRLVRRVG